MTEDLIGGAETPYQAYVTEVVYSSDMALTALDKEWIQLTIAASIADSKKGWLEKVRLWSAPSIAVGIFAIVLTQWSGYIEFKTHTNDVLESINTRLATLSPTVDLKNQKVDSILAANLTDKNKDLGLKTIAILADAARKQGVDADQNSVAKVGGWDVDA